MSVIIAPSVLSADFGNLQRDCEMINHSDAGWYHVDVMDGVFVPNISFGFPVMNVLKKHASKTLDVHLMIVEPERYIQRFAEAGADVLTVHYEASTHLHRSLAEIRKQGMKAGVALNPHTPVSLLHDIIQDCDLVLIMSVNPGFGGQAFIENTYRKVSELKELILQRNSQALIEVDGGVSESNALALAKAGADVLVAGNAVFATPDPLATIAALHKTANS
ncbi:MAG: ribulose-phosphate 3-epimerase [Sphingomonadales bacterium]|jgi:ribulose-phosphate 3-epimerase